jgi:hypothetical protein
MALVKGAWVEKTVNKRYVATCRVSGDTTENDLYTLKTPANLNPTKPWTLIVAVSEDLTSAGTSALDIYGGFSDNFAITGNDATVAATDGALAVAISTDVDAGGMFMVKVVPGDNGGLTQVTTLPATVILPPLPYYAFNIDCTAVLQDAAYIDFTVIQ